jgi:transposase
MRALSWADHRRRCPAPVITSIRRTVVTASPGSATSVLVLNLWSSVWSNRSLMGRHQATARTRRIRGTKTSLTLHHFYRATAWVGEELEEKPKDALAPRCVKDEIEEQLFERRRDLFSDLSVVFMDTTSLSFYGEGGETLGENGFSKDFRPDLKQMILGLVIDGDGWPICTEMWPGNTADVSTLLNVVDRLRLRFAIRRVCVVADRGMISAATIAGLEERGLEYILGARERSDTIAKSLVLNNRDPFVPLLIERQRGETQLFAKEVKVEGKRYIICRNEAEAEKDRLDRQAIIAALQDALQRGEKVLIGNAGYRRYLRKRSATRGERAFEIDTGKLAEEARFDGIFVLRTNANVTPLQAVLRYRELLQVEQLFRQSKAVFDTRPIFHSSDAAIRGHVFCTFLALLLQKHLNDLARSAGSKVEWTTLLRELDQLTEVRMRYGEKDWLVRTDATPTVAAIFRQAHIAMPPRARQTLPPKPPELPKTPRRRGRPRRSATSPRISPEIT